jgi:hypothetical protein
MIDLRYISVKTGGTDGSTAVVPEQSTSVDFTQETSVDFGAIECRYDKVRGELTFTTDYQTFVVSGFLTLQKIGVGRRGKRGIRGVPGTNGVDGRVGRDGPTGCAGPVGAKGRKGTTGNAGEDGPRGVTGKLGCIGPAGPIGNEGPIGPTGPDGVRGADGPACIAGPRGPTGQAPITNVVVQDTQPEDPLIYLWGKPVNPGDIPDVPSEVAPMTGIIVSKSMTLSPTGAGQFYQGTLSFVLQNFAGGSGSFTFRWFGGFLTDNAITYADTGLDARNINLTCRVQIPTGQTIERSGLIQLAITDTITNQVLTLTANYLFSGRNESSTGGGGGGGCIVYGQKVSYGRSKIRVEDLLVGDTVNSLAINGVPDSSDGKAKHLDWYSTNPAVNESSSHVRIADHSTFHTYHSINKELSITRDEVVFVRRENVWQFMRVLELRLTDWLWHEEGPREITSIDIITEDVNVVSLDVEDVDTYFVSGYLVHNQDAGGPVSKH